MERGRRGGVALSWWLSSHHWKLLNHLASKHWTCLRRLEVEYNHFLLWPTRWYWRTRKQFSMWQGHPYWKGIRRLGTRSGLSQPLDLALHCHRHHGLPLVEICLHYMPLGNSQIFLWRSCCLLGPKHGVYSPSCREGSFCLHRAERFNSSCLSSYRGRHSTPQ